MVRALVRGVCCFLGCVGFLANDGLKAYGEENAACASQAPKMVEVGLKSIRMEPYSEHVDVTFTHGARPSGGDLNRYVDVVPALDNVQVRAAGWYDSPGLRISGDWQAERTYSVRVKAGIPFCGHKRMLKEGVLHIRIPRAMPRADLLSGGIFYPLSRQRIQVPLSLRNVTALNVTVRQLKADNLIPYSLSESRLSDTAITILERKFDISSQDNQEEEFLFDLGSVLPPDKVRNGMTWKPGIYMIDFSGWDKVSQNYSNWLENRLLVMTNLGLAVCHDEEEGQMLVCVRRLSDNQPVKGARVLITSRKNIRIGEGLSDQDGLCRVDVKSGLAGEDYPRLVLVQSGEDIAFVELYPHHHYRAVSAWNQREYAESSKPLERGPLAFVYWERGAIRPGESGYVSAFLRTREDKSLPVLRSYPCVLELMDPAGNVVNRAKVTSDRFGYVSHRFDFSGSVSTGRYTARCCIDGGRELGSADVLVASFVPDRLKVTAAVDRSIVSTGEAFTGTCQARFYYGEPAEKSRGHLAVISEGDYQPAHWRDYAVGGLSKNEKLEPLRTSFQELGREGRRLTYQIPKDFRSNLPQRLLFQGTVLEAGGRAVTRSSQVIVDTQGWYLGLSQPRGDEARKKDVLVDYRLLGVDPKASPQLQHAVTVTAKLYSIAWDLIQRKTSSGYRWEWNRFREPYGQDIPLTMTESRGTFRLPNLEDGHYEIEFHTGNGGGTLLDCWHYYGEGGKRTPDPNVLTFVTDRTAYLPGQVAEVSFEATGDGYGILVCGESGMEKTMTVKVHEGKNILRVPIPQWLPTENYFCCLTTVTGTEPHSRLFGIARLKVSQEKRRIKVKIQTQDVARPEETVALKVKLEDGNGKPVTGLAQVFLVDCGVLSLTDYKTPDIHGFFHGGRTCRLNFWDLYDELYPELKLQGIKRIGGDRISGRLRQKFGQEVESQSAVVYLPPVEVDARGEAEIRVKIPKFLGAMRVMCVASSDRQVGSGETELIVRDKIGVTGSCPRGVVPGDEFDCVFTANNFDLPDGAFDLSISLPESLQPMGPVAFSGQLHRGAPIVRSVRVRVRERLGAARIAFALTMGGHRVSESMNLVVRGVNPPVSTSETVVIQPGAEEKFALDNQSWLAGTARGKLSVGGMPVTGMTDGLAWLNAYPYGCLEQTVACVFPFLRLDQLQHLGLASPEEADTYRTKTRLAVDRIKSLYLHGGKFALWPGSRDYALHASLFTANFLFELNRQIPQERTLLKSIEQQFLNVLVEDTGYARDIRGYGCYVLSLLNDGTSRGDSTGTVAAMNLLADKTINLGSLLASAALIKSGHAAEGMPVFRKCLEQDVWREDIGDYIYGDEASRLGMALYLAVDIMPRDSLTSALAYRLAQRVRKDGKGWGTTQANAWATLALTAYAARYQNDVAAGEVTWGSGTRAVVPSKGVGSWNLKQGEGVSVRNKGKAPLFVTVRKEGVPRGRMEPISGALTVKRRYLTMSGQPVFSANQGDLLTVRLELDSLCNVSDLVLVDLLPGGLEIEDDSLVTRATAVRREATKDNRLMPIYVERRDDRLVLFGNVLSSGRGVYTYRVRAVTRGKFSIPPVSVEAMYAPDLRAVGVQDDAFEVK